MDICSFVFSDQVWAMSNHMAIAGTGGQPTYTRNDPDNKRYWEIKGSGGNPWDGNSYDDDLLYQNITDIDTPLVPGGPTSWTDASMFKMFASTSRPGNGGIAWGPRQYNPSGSNPPIITPNTTYRTYSACGVFTVTEGGLGGPAQVKWEGPYPLGDVIPNFGSAIDPATPVLLQSYQWNPGYSVLEQNVYAGANPAKGTGAFGRIQWQSFDLVGGVYVLNKTSLFNSLVSGGIPPVNFPCGWPALATAA